MRELNNTGLLICIELLAFCIIIMTVMFFYSVKFISRKRFKTSRIILIVSLCYGAVIDCDLVNAIYTGFPTRVDWFYYTVNTIRYVAYVLAALSWFLYCQREFKSSLVSKKSYMFLWSIPALFSVVLIAISPINGIVYSSSPHGMIEGPMYPVVQSIAYAYIAAAALFAFLRIIRTTDKDVRKNNWAIILCALPLIASDIIQKITGYPFLCIGVTIALAMVFANLIIGTYYKNEKKEILGKQRRDALVNGLTEDYEAVFIVDIDKDFVKPIRLSNKYVEEFDYKVNDRRYTYQIRTVFDKYALKEEQDDLTKQFAPENVWNRLKDDISFAVSFRIIVDEDRELYYRAKFVRLQDTDARRCILGFRNDDSHMRNVLELERLREEQAVKERTSKLSTIIEAMTTEYLMLVAVNLDTGELDMYRETYDYKIKSIFNHSVVDYNELLYRFADEFVEDEDRGEFIREMDSNTIIDNLKTRKNYYVRLKRKGQDNWYEVNASDYDTVTGNVVIGVRNIDEVVREERQREKLTRELEDAKQHEFIAALTLDFDCVSHIDVNNNLKETFYRTSPTFYGRMPEWAKKAGFATRIKVYSDIFVVPEDQEKFLAEVETNNLLSKFDNKSVHFVNFRINVDDEIRYYQVKFIANKVDGKVQSLVAGFHDVDDEMKEELKRQELLEEAKEIAEEGNRAKTMFLFNMSHDIRTPMNAIIGFTNMAMKNIDNKDRALDALGKARDSSDVLLSLINQILDMSRIESGKVELAEDKSDIFSCGRDIRPMLEELASDKNIKFTCNIFNIADRYIYFDKVRIEEIMVNIVGNAIKYTQEGGFVNVDVTQTNDDALDISSFSNGEDKYGIYEYKISDNGYGMSEEFQKHLFEDFSREETTIKNSIQGTGLGLPLCKRLVDLMHGRIDVVSEQNVGSTFTITLPFRLREPDVTDEEEVVVEDLEEKFVGKRLLLAEDNELNREIAIDILSEDGFIVEEARDGREAVDKIRENGDDYYDFILMDIRMPYMDGYEATKQIRGICKRHIPIIALSANAFEEDRAKSIKVGMDDHVAKPIEVDKLKMTLARFL
ncbi:MAG: response regulator [Lachnospiraceae bacterium]|nr:response regulator [Lachnospiraceae bacterium]